MNTSEFEDWRRKDRRRTMILLGILVLLMLILGTIAYRTGPTAQDIENAKQQKCISYGAQPGSKEYVTCRAILDAQAARVYNDAATIGAITAVMGGASN